MSVFSQPQRRQGRVRVDRSNTAILSQTPMVILALHHGFDRLPRIEPELNDSRSSRMMLDCECGFALSSEYLTVRRTSG